MHLTQLRGLETLDRENAGHIIKDFGSAQFGKKKKIWYFCE